jgi:hypothetical protein
LEAIRMNGKVIDRDQAREAHPDFLTEDAMKRIHDGVMADMEPSREDALQAVLVYQQVCNLSAATGNAADLAIALSFGAIQPEAAAHACDVVAARAESLARLLRSMEAGA